MLTWFHHLFAADLSGAYPRCESLFHHNPKVLYWWLWQPFESNKLSVMFKKLAGNDLSFVTWHIMLLEVAISSWYTVVGCSTGIKSSEVCEENIPYTNTSSLIHWYKAGRSIFFCLRQILALQYECNSWNRESLDQEVSIFGEHVQILASVSFSLLTVAPSVIFCCKPSGSRFDGLCIQSCFSTYLGFNNLLSELLLPFCHLNVAWLSSCDINVGFTMSDPPLTGYFLLLDHSL